MDGYGPHTYGESFADVYDDWYGEISDVDATVAGIATLAAGGMALELGVGTGRLAVPLADAGTPVVGVDASVAMLQRLSEKTGGDAVMAILADMSHLALPANRFAVAFCAFNTFFNLTSPDSQRRCVAEVRRTLVPDGVLAIEGFVPPPEGMHASGLSVQDTATGLMVTASVHDEASQLIRGQHVDVGVDGVRLRPWALHYRSPEQLDDLVTRLGFVREARWADWSGRPFTADASSHVSVYRATPVTRPRAAAP